MPERNSVGRPSVITDAIIKAVMENLKIEQSHIDKSKEVIDMISFTKENGKDVIVVQIGDNVKITINK